jgi:hypothetical protein
MRKRKRSLNKKMMPRKTRNLRAKRERKVKKVKKARKVRRAKKIKRNLLNQSLKPQNLSLPILLLLDQSPKVE